MLLQKINVDAFIMVLIVVDSYESTTFHEFMAVL